MSSFSRRVVLAAQAPSGSAAAQGRLAGLYAVEHHLLTGRCSLRCLGLWRLGLWRLGLLHLGLLHLRLLHLGLRLTALLCGLLPFERGEHAVADLLWNRVENLGGHVAAACVNELPDGQRQKRCTKRLIADSILAAPFGNPREFDSDGSVVFISAHDVLP